MTDNFVTLPAAQPDGSSVELTAPCDSGTATLNAHRDGVGVAVNAVLRHVAHARWWSYIYITPYYDPGGDPDMASDTAHDGVLRLHATNLVGQAAAEGLRRAWPQAVDLEVDSEPATDFSSCTMEVYLSARKAQASTHFLLVTARPTAGTVRIEGIGIYWPGQWRLQVTAWSSAGVQCQTRTVVASHSDPQNYYSATFTGFTGLSDFTKIAVTATTANREHSNWLYLTRTP